MTANNTCSLPSDDDLRDALKEMKTYMDVTEDDLRKIYEIALRHARDRVTDRVPILVREVMTKKAVSVTKDADLQEAARILSERGISGMPVVDDQNRVLGVISEADILMLAGMKKGHTFRDVLRTILGEPVPARTANGDTVENGMSFPPITSKADDDIAEVAKIFDEKRIKRLPVVDDDGHLLGIISRSDLVRVIGNRRNDHH